MRNVSGIFAAPERRMSSCVITCNAPATSESFSSRFENEVTGIFIKSSIDMLPKSGAAASSAAPDGPLSNKVRTPTVTANDRHKSFFIARLCADLTVQQAEKDPSVVSCISRKPRIYNEIGCRPKSHPLTEQALRQHRARWEYR